MFNKVYLSRRQTKAMSIDYPIGDPFGGAAYREMRDPVSAAISVGGSLLGGAMSSGAASSAANTQAKAAQAALDQQMAIYQQQQQQQAPGRAVGYQSLNTLGSMLPGQYQTYDAQGNPIGTATGNGSLTQTFGPEQLASNLAPNYEFMKNQGLGATRMGANVGGGGSNVNIAGTKFAEDYASNAYQNAFNNFQTGQTNIYNRLAGIAGLGQTSQAQTNTAAGNYGNASTGLITGAGAAQAAGTVGSTNALTGALGNSTNMYALSNLLNPSSNNSNTGDWSLSGLGITAPPSTAGNVGGA